MGLSTSQRFLIEANRVAGANDCFRWQGVGEALGYSPAQAGVAVQSLGDRRLLVPLADGEVRISPAGRILAEKLELKLGNA